MLDYGASFFYPIPEVGDVERRIEAELIAGTPLEAVRTPEDGDQITILTDAGGTPFLPGMLIQGVIGYALRRTFYSQLPRDETAFAGLVEEGFRQLKAALRGEKLPALVINGLHGIRLSDGATIETPWGDITAVPWTPPARLFNPYVSKANCMLVTQRLFTTTLRKRADPDARKESHETSSATAELSLPLACALASSDGEALAVPVFTWWTIVMPLNAGWGSTVRLHTPTKAPTDITPIAKEVSDWAYRIERADTTKVAVAARRIVSAAAYRSDPSDRLIDAVMAWENLVGTEHETKFRVTGALCKLLEPDPSKRSALVTKLKVIYDLRSDVVHGRARTTSELEEKSKDAIRVAAQALRTLFLMGDDWIRLRSEERANRLLLQEP